MTDNHNPEPCKTCGTCPTCGAVPQTFSPVYPSPYLHWYNPTWTSTSGNTSYNWTITTVTPDDPITLTAS